GVLGGARHRHRRDRRRAGPLETVSAVTGGVVDEPSIEDGPSAPVKLGEVGLLPPTEEGIGAKRLEVALEVSEQRRRMGVLEGELRGLVLDVQDEHEST